MTNWLRKVGLVAKLSVSAFARERGFWVAILAAVLTSAVGWWWRDINFGGKQGSFVLNFGLSIQSLGAMILAIVIVGQMKVRQMNSGHMEVAVARGIWPTILVAGELVGAVLLVAVFIGGCVAVQGVLLVLGDYAAGWDELFIVSGMQLVKAAVIIAFCRWFGAFGRSLFFVLMAATLLTVVGHIKIWTETLGGLGWWLTRPVPNLAWLGEAGYRNGAFDASGTMKALIYALGYILVFLILAAKAEARRE